MQALVASLLLAVPFQEDPSTQAAAILAAQRATLGDAERLAAHATGLHSEGTSEWVGLQSGLTLVEERGPLGHFRSVTDYPGFGTFEQASDGVVSWQTGMLEGVEVREGWDAALAQRSMEIPRNTDWHELYTGARLAGSEELGGVACHVLELTPRATLWPASEADAAAGEAGEDATPAPGPDRWWIGVEDHELRRVELRSLTEQGGMQMDLGDWRAVDGVRYPHRVQVAISGFTLVTSYTLLRHGETYAEDYFAPSEEVLSALERKRSGSDAERDRTIVVEPTDERPIASVRLKVEHVDMQRTLAVLLPEVMQVVLSQGRPMDGPPLVRYHSFGDEVDLEAAIPVRTPIESVGRVKASLLPACEAAKAWHIGPYEELGQAYERLQAFFDEQGLEPAGAPWEEYWTDPGLEPDPAKWRTRVVWPVRRRER